VVEYPGGLWGAAEVKLGSSAVGAAEASLLKLRDERVDLNLARLTLVVKWLQRFGAPC
jgi:hypothetical protein